MRIIRLALFVTCAAIAFARLRIPSHPLSWPGAYEAFAHLFMGGLIGAWMTCQKREERSKYLFMITVLALVELTAFLAKL